jgi:hypothetical protein
LYIVAGDRRRIEGVLALLSLQSLTTVWPIIKHNWRAIAEPLKPIIKHNWRAIAEPLRII